MPQPPYGADPIEDGWRRQAIVAVALMVWLLSLLLRRRLPRPKALSAALVLYAGALIIANFANPDWRLGVEPILDLLTAILVFDILCDAPGISQSSLRWALMFMALALAVLSLHAVWERWQDWLTLIGAVPDSGSSLFPPTVPRVLGIGTNPNILAPLMTLASPLFLVAMIGGRRWKRIAATTALLLVQIAVFFTLSRAAWIGELAGFAVAALGILFALRKIRLPNLRLILIAFACVVAAVVAAIVLSTALRARPLWLFRPSLAARSDFRSAAVHIIRQHPMFGAGPGRFPLLYPEISQGDPAGAVHSHNILLQISVEGGGTALFAAIIVAIFVAAALRRQWQIGDRNGRVLIACVVGSLTAFLVGGMADSLHLFPEILFVLAALVALSLQDSGTAAGKPHLRHSGVLRRGAGFALSLSPLLLATLLGVAWLRIDQASAHYHRSIDLASKQQWRESAAEADRAAEIDPHLALYRVQSGMALAILALNSNSADARGQAVQRLQLALAQEPRSGATRLDLADLFQAEGRSADLPAQLPLAIRESPRDALVLLGVGVLGEGTSWPNTISAYSSALAENPRLADSPFWQSTAYRRANFAEIVRQSLARAEREPSGSGYQAVQEIILDGASPPLALGELPSDAGFISVIDRAETAEANGDSELAVQLLQGAIAARPDDPAARLALGNLRSKQGDVAGARRQWLAGAYLGDTASILGLGDSFLPGAVPAQIQALGQWSLINLWLRQLSITQQQYRFSYRRQEPWPIILPGDWLNGLPRVYTTMTDAVERWKASGGADSGR